MKFFCDNKVWGTQKGHVVPGAQRNGNAVQLSTTRSHLYVSSKRDVHTLLVENQLELLI